MASQLSSTTQGAIILSAFLVPVLTYIYFTRSTKSTSPKASAGPLPEPFEITALYIHPIKSCHGIQVKSAKLLPTGLDLDRQWMWVTHPGLEFQTIRQNSKMTLIRPSYDGATDTLTITAPAPNSMDEKLEFSIPAHPSPEWLKSNTNTEKVKIWEQWTPAHVYPPELTKKFNDFFGSQVRLVYKPPSSTSPRKLRSNGAEEHLGRQASTCFPDLMPLLLGSTSSLDELNSRLKSRNARTIAPIDVTRFRPNILINGDSDAPWDEDRWKTFSIIPAGPHGGEAMTFDITQRCARCRVPNVDPETAEEDKKEPWDTLVGYRRIDEGIKWKPCFGMLCVPRLQGGGQKVKVGDKVRVTQVTVEHRYKAGF